jgi:hypothetical protein
MLTKRILAAPAVAGALQACSTIGVDQMVVSNAMVTSARGGYVFDETPRKEIKQRDSLVVITHLKWEPADTLGGSHSVSWTWYAGDKVVAVRKQDMRFHRSPMRLSWRIPAADFDPGHYRVDVAIDGKVVDTREYDIVQ